MRKTLVVYKWGIFVVWVIWNFSLLSSFKYPHSLLGIVGSVLAQEDWKDDLQEVSSDGADPQPKAGTREQVGNKNNHTMLAILVRMPWWWHWVSFQKQKHFSFSELCRAALSCASRTLTLARPFRSKMTSAPWEMAMGQSNFRTLRVKCLWLRFGEMLKPSQVSYESYIFDKLLSPN